MDRLKRNLIRRVSRLAKLKAKLSIQKRNFRLELFSIKTKRDGSYYKKDQDRVLFLRAKIELLKREIQDCNIEYWSSIRSNDKYKSYKTFDTWTSAYQLTWKYFNEAA